MTFSNNLLERQDRFEVWVISVNWLVLLSTAILLSIVFRKRWQAVAARPA